MVILGYSGEREPIKILISEWSEAREGYPIPPAVTELQKVLILPSEVYNYSVHSVFTRMYFCSPEMGGLYVLPRVFS